jgi:hypothetical protein
MTGIQLPKRLAGLGFIFNVAVSLTLAITWPPNARNTKRDH